MRFPALPAAGLMVLRLLSEASGAAQPPALSAQEGWVRATPGVDVAAAYLTLHNTGAQPVAVTGVESPVAAAAMIHETSIADGRASMRPHEPLVLAAGATVRLAPGGLHIMLQGLKHPLAPGDEVPLVLHLQGGGVLSITARVRPPAES